VDLDLMGRSEHYSVSSHPPILVLAWVRHYCVRQMVSTLLKGLTPKAVAAARILLNLPEWRPFIASWILFSYSGSSVTYCLRRAWWAGAMLNEAILDAWDQPNWNSDMAKCDVGQLPYWVMIVQDRRPEAQIARYSYILNHGIHYRVYV